MDQNENVLTPEDSLVEELIEEPQEDESISLEEALDEGGGQAETEPAQGTGEGEAPRTQPQEPGYVKRRISEAVDRALAQQREAFEAQMAPMREYMLTQEAQELVRTGKVKDLETAKELVRYRQGQPQPQPEQLQPRNERGQFTRQAEDVAVQTRISMLQHQADTIRDSGGPDVIAEFRSNAEIKAKVVSGEMDFHDVARYMQKGQKKKSAPMRSPNGASSSSRAFDFASMSSDQFAKLEKRIQEGARIALK